MIKAEKELNLRQIKQSLGKLLEDDRYDVFFWYDTKAEFRREYEKLNLENLIKYELNNNEFNLRYEIHAARQEKTEAKFLIYSNSARLADEDNCLLDLLLSNHEFIADKVSMYLTELDLEQRHRALIAEHINFFDHSDNRKQVKAFIKKFRETHSYIDEAAFRLKILNISLGSEGKDLETALEKLLKDYWEAEDSSPLENLKEYNLLDYLIEKLKLFDYEAHPEADLLHHFTVKLFDTVFQKALGKSMEKSLNDEAIIFLNNFKNNRMNVDLFKSISKKIAEILAVEKQLEGLREIDALFDIDIYELIEKKIISETRDGIIANKLSSKALDGLIRKRKASIWWFEEYKDVYEALNRACELLYKLNNLEKNFTLDVLSFIGHYVNHDFKIDQLYRQFNYHKEKSNSYSLLDSLSCEIENKYNLFLVELNNKWQIPLDQLQEWKFPEDKMQRNFFKYTINDSSPKYAVLISDALRYEVAEELARRLDSTKFKIENDYMISTLPSWTQFGMAALLPTDDIRIDDKNIEKELLVLKNKKSTKGLSNRTKILMDYFSTKNKQATALRFEDKDKVKGIKSKTNTEIRELIKENDLVLIYHDRIDATGDDTKTEQDIFKACEDTITEIQDLLKKLFNNNVHHVIITSDHGFIYQNKVDEFLSENIDSKTILKRDRRFLVGKNLDESSGFKKFTSKALGFSCEYDFLFPKSINRLRLQGSGAHFVHGGTSLQEIIIPNLKISLLNTGRVEKESVEAIVIRGSNSVISSNQFIVKLYQDKAVSEKVSSIKIKLGLYSATDELISDTKILNLDSSSDNALDREFKVELLLSAKADDFNKQDVYLVIKKYHEKSHEFRDESDEMKRQHRYELRKSFTSDF